MGRGWRWGGDSIQKTTLVGEGMEKFQTFHVVPDFIHLFREIIIRGIGNNRTIVGDFLTNRGTNLLEMRRDSALPVFSDASDSISERIVEVGGRVLGNNTGHGVCVCV